VFWPQDFIFLAGLLVIAALSLFFFTALAGRLWCGYACPQTVWTEVFLALERIAEGDRGQRMKLDKAPWSWHKFRRKGLKQLLWISFAVWTGVTFVGFFTPMRELVTSIWHFQLGSWELFWICFYGFATYGNAGYLREQVCKYMCPYARFQSAMFDHDTLIISYDSARGEPRGVGKQRTGLGDCIECTLCVQVCPTGIDIRDGLQYECIACGACIDACDQVMEKVGKPLGLICYTTENALQAKPSRIMRPRIWIYGALLTVLLCSIAFGLIERKPLIVDVLRDRNALYRIASDAEVENSYTIKITNKATQSRRFSVTLAGNSAIQMREPSVSVEVEGRSTYAHPVTLFAPTGQLATQTEISFIVRAQDQANVERTVKSKFFAPTGGSQ
jgi:cytochrome c oxidase accessory protein FixG